MLIQDTFGFLTHLYSTGYNRFVFDPNVHEVCTKSAVGFQLDENVANALLVFFCFRANFDLTATDLLHPSVMHLNSMECITNPTQHYSFSIP